MARDTLDRAFRATTPDDSLDPPRFSQVSETVKDALVLELRKFIAESAQTSMRREELVTIEKYQTFTGNLDAYETVARVVRKHPDVLERLPHIAVLSGAGNQRPLTIGPPILASVQEPPRLEVTGDGPFELADGAVLALRTKPDGVTARESNLVFVASRFVDITAATKAEVIRAINEQALYVRATATDDGFVIATGGPLGGQTPNEIEVLPETSDEVIAEFGLATSGTGDTLGGTAPSMVLTDAGAAFAVADVGRYVTLTGCSKPYFNDGRFPITARTATTLTFTNKYGKSGTAGTWFIGDRDDSTNSLRPPMNRYAFAWDMSVQLEVLCSDENTRGEVNDLVASFFTFWLESRMFTFWGRSSIPGSTDPATAGEHYQIVLKPNFRQSGENEVGRPGNDGTDKIYVSAFTCDLTVSFYLDRPVLAPDAFTEGWTVDAEDFSPDETLPMPS